MLKALGVRYSKLHTLRDFITRRCHLFFEFIYGQIHFLCTSFYVIIPFLDRGEYFGRTPLLDTLLDTLLLKSLGVRHSKLHSG